jgi:hypothetical protein
VLALKPSQILLALGVVSQEEYGGFGEGPCEVSIADLLPLGAVTLAGGFLGTLDEPPFDTSG